MLQNLVPWKKITAELGSGGSVYDALAEFMKSGAVQIHNNKKRELQILETEKSNLLSSIQSLETQKQETDQQHKSLTSDVSTLQTKNNNIKKELEKLSKQKKEIDEYLKKIADKDIDPPLLEKIASFDTKNKKEITERLDTLEHLIPKNRDN